MSSAYTFTGACHCGAIKYTIDLPTAFLEDPYAVRCNCTWCQKSMFTSLKLDSLRNSFILISPTDRRTMGDYPTEGIRATLHRYFCQACGSHIFREGGVLHEGQWLGYFALNLCTIDQPQEGIELSRFKIKYVDGLHDNHAAGTHDMPWEGGLL